MQLLELWIFILSIMFGTSAVVVYAVFFSKQYPVTRSTQLAGLGVILCIVSLACVLYLYVGSSQLLAITWRRAELMAKLPPDWKNPEKLIQRLQTEVRLHPESGEAWMILSRMLMSVGRYEDAMLAFEHACTLKPSASCFVQHAEAIYNAQGKFSSQADALIQQALVLAPDNSDALNLEALSAYTHHQYKTAIELWNKVLVALPVDSPSAALLQEAIARSEAALKKSTSHEETTRTR